MVYQNQKQGTQWSYSFTCHYPECSMGLSFWGRTLQASEFGNESKWSEAMTKMYVCWVCALVSGGALSVCVCLYGECVLCVCVPAGAHSRNVCGRHEEDKNKPALGHTRCIRKPKGGFQSPISFVQFAAWHEWNNRPATIYLEVITLNNLEKERGDGASVCPQPMW